MNDEIQSDGVSTRALAELARAGYSSLMHPSMDVEFEVHHLRDRQGYLAGILVSEGGGEGGFLETLSSAANGVGLVIGTNTRRTPDQPIYRDKGGMHDPKARCEQNEDLHRFHGSARPNLTFLYETARRFEAIVAVDTDTGPLTMLHAKRLRDLLQEISAIAVETAKAPLLSVQSPAQVPVQPLAEFDEEEIPEAASKAIRFAIALPQPSAELSFALADRITAYCHDHSLSLWLRDTRLGCRAGNWFEVLDDSRRGRTAQDEPGEGLEYILPVTFVGPARVGSTHSIVSALAQLPGIGVAGCSITLLDDLAFIHLQLALPYASNGELIKMHAVGKSPAAFLEDVLCPAVGSPQTFVVTEVAGDYQTLAGPLLEYTNPYRHRRLAIWLSWQMNRTDEGLAVPLASMAKALRKMGIDWGSNLKPGAPTANVEYLVCRDRGNSVLRGKGKLSVPYQFVSRRFPKRNLEPSPSQLCVALEDAWKVAADEDRSGANIREITISWREYWLGHWAAPIS